MTLSNVTKSNRYNSGGYKPIPITVLIISFISRNHMFERFKNEYRIRKIIRLM